MRSGGYCEWHGQAQLGGRWIWSVNGVVMQDGSDNSFLYGGVSQGFTIGLTLINSGGTGSDFQGVSVTSTARLCCDLSPGPACPLANPSFARSPDRRRSGADAEHRTLS